ncbi:MAG: cryptochrome/photolyase family protein [Pontimonas sp.]
MSAGELQRFLTPDQLGPHFDDGGPLLVVDNRGVFRRRPFHRQKAHLILSALHHRIAEWGERVEWHQAQSYREVLRGRNIEVINPTSYGLRNMVAELSQSATVEVLPSRGFVTTEEQFQRWAEGRGPRQMLMETFYRDVRVREGILMVPETSHPSGVAPEGGAFNFDHDNRQPPPKGQTTLGLPEPRWPVEDEIDQWVREELDRMESAGEARFIGRDGPRVFAATRQEALAALEDFLDHRLSDFGPYEDAAMPGDWPMAHSLLSVPMNLGLLDPREVINSALERYHRGDAPLNSVEGFVRQIAGWRDWVWHLYWHMGEDYVKQSNYFAHEVPLPPELATLDPDLVSSACLKQVISEVRDRGWTHHINRLMVLGNHALQRRINPAQLNEWFIDAFVDGTPWVMPANVVGMSQHADGGVVATKPYLSGGAYLKKMTQYCQSCPFRPDKRVGDDACPFTAGYWAFLHDHREALRGNHRMSKPMAGMSRLTDLEELVTQEHNRRAW